RELHEPPGVVQAREGRLVDDDVTAALERGLDPPGVIAVDRRDVHQLGRALPEGALVVVEDASRGVRRHGGRPARRPLHPFPRRDAPGRRQHAPLDDAGEAQEEKVHIKLRQASRFRASMLTIPKRVSSFSWASVIHTKSSGISRTSVAGISTIMYRFWKW